MNDKIADARRTARVWKLYERLFGIKAPKGWTIEWHIDALTIPEIKRVYLGMDSTRDPYDLQTVIHELLHVYDPKLKHGPKFNATVRALLRKAKGGKGAVSSRRPKHGRGPNRQGALA